MAVARPVRVAHRGLTPAAALLGAAAVAWAVSAERMRGMDMGPGTDPGALGWFVVTWALMMAAMMLPALVPVARSGDARPGTGRSAAVSPAFVTGYLGVWTSAGVAAYAVVAALRAAHPGWLAWDAGGRWLACGVILAAAAYQLTAAKGSWLDRCRSTPGPDAQPRGGGLRGGLRHGGACVGCCGGLMAVLFVVGVMSLTWMVVVTVLVGAERLLPWRTPAVYAVAGALAVLAVWIAADPSSVPGLTLPAPMGGM
jgi:predicted metal-binding membrane protein